MEEIKKEMSYGEAIEWLKGYIADSGKTQSAVAAELGVSSGLVSSFLSGSYKAPANVIPKIAELAQTRQKKEVVPKEPDYAETTISRAVINAIENAKLRGKVNVIFGDAGVGKTCAIREYVRHNSLALYITVSPTFASISGVNELIAEQLGIKERTARRITMETVERLKDSGRVMIVDEAQHLTVKALDHLRSISDAAGIGIALVGNDSVYTKMGAGRNPDFAQLYSRIGVPEEVKTDQIKTEDIRAIFGAYGLSEDVTALLTAVARTPYGVRGAVNVFVNAAAMYGKVERDGVVQIIRKLRIAVPERRVK